MTGASLKELRDRGEIVISTEDATSPSDERSPTPTRLAATFQQHDERVVPDDEDG